MTWLETALSLAALSGISAGCLTFIRLRRLRSGILDCAHELARPLTALMLALDRRHPDDGTREAMAGEAERARLALGDLRALAGACPPDRDDVFDLTALASEIADSWTPIALIGGRSLRIEGERPVQVGCDRARAGQVITGLVANAIEHGSGTVRLGVSCREGRAVLEVRDDGPGSSHVTRRERWGRGRGLRIARRSARMCGGLLDVSFSRGGSSAGLSLPQAGRGQ